MVAMVAYQSFQVVAEILTPRLACASHEINQIRNVGSEFIQTARAPSGAALEQASIARTKRAANVGEDRIW